MRATEFIVEGVAEGLNELTNTSLKVKQPKDFVNTNDRKQVTWKVMKFKSGKDTYLINFTMQDPPAFGKKLKSNWNAVNVAFGVKEPQDEYSFGDEINTDLTARNKNQFLIYSTVINAIRKFITEYNTEIDEIIMQGAGERQQAMYQRFFQSAGKYFPGWHYNGKHSLVRDVPRQTGKKVKEQGVDEGVSNDMSTEDMIAYLRQHHDTNLHQDYLNHVNTFSKFVLKDIPTNTLKTDLPGLDREKVERYKKMDQSKAPPIVLGGKYILDGYHRANAVKELGIPTIKAYVGITTK
jgi:hypothetical protein